MAHLLRLIVAALLFCCSSAYALIPQVNTYTTAFVNPLRYDTETAACTADFAGYNASQTTFTATFSGITVSGSIRNCDGPAIRRSTGVDAGRRTVAVTGTLGCPSNSAAVSGGCQCNSGYQQNAAGTACEVPPAPTCPGLGTSMGGAGAQHTSAGYTGGLICQGGCSAAPASAGKVGDVWYGWGPFTSIGTACSGTVGGSGDMPASAPPKNDAPAPCATGQCPGTVNGTSICVPCDTTKEDPPPKTDTDIKTNADGSTTTTTTTTNTVNSCSGNSCNSTTTTTVVSGGKNADGTTKTPATTTTEDTKEQTRGDFCKDNPNNASCKDIEQTSFAGTCAGGFKAKSDDAVLNAMAEEQYRRNCEMLRTDGEPSQWLQAESLKTGDRTGDLPGNKTVSISGADIDTSDALGGGGCNLDKTITVAKMTVTLPFNKVCSPLEVFGQLLVAVSMLLAGRIIMRG